MPDSLRPNNTLLIFSPLAVPQIAPDALELPRKYLTAITAFAEQWQGPLTLVLPQASKRDDNLDYVSVNRATLSFRVCALPKDEAALRALIQSAAVVLVPLVSRYVQIPGLCAACNVPFVPDADYTPAIREEIVRTENKNPLLYWRRLLWQRNMEKTYTAMVRAAQGIHLQGPQAYAAYAPLNPSPLLYLDTRAPRAMQPTAEQMRARIERLREGAPLRLVYSGRWRPMKGVMDLPRVADELRRPGVQAEWDIFGGGMLEQELKKTVAGARLDNMRLRGELAFPALMRMVQENCDLFVCCHQQGDPASTFIEMLSVGIPLVGYDTGGLRGIVSLSGAGWLTPRNNPSALATRIAELDRDRAALVAASQAAVEFVKDKSFEDMIQQRTTHLTTIATEFAAQRRGEGSSR